MEGKLVDGAEEAEEEEGVEEVEGIWGLLMVHLLFPFLKVIGSAWIWMQRFVFLASLDALSLLANLMSDVPAITLSSSRAAEGEVNAGSGPAVALSLPSLTWSPSLSLEPSLTVHAEPWATPGETLWGGRVAPGGAVHFITDSSVLLPSLQ